MHPFLIYPRKKVKTTGFNVTHPGMNIPPYDNIPVVFLADRRQAAGHRGPPTEDLDGYVGELLLYTKTLNATEVQNTENYLKTKWGIT
jgi:hypothetical protein